MPSAVVTSVKRLWAATASATLIALFAFAISIFNDWLLITFCISCFLPLYHSITTESMVLILSNPKKALLSTVDKYPR